MFHKNPYLIGYASDIAGAYLGSAEGPMVMKDSVYTFAMNLNWETILKPDMSLPSKLRIVERLSQELSLLTVKYVLENKFFIVMGGDHTSAIGTWSGVSHAQHASGPVGLIWIDAHFDSHTLQTSESGNLHGMPLACLLGVGESLLTKILNPNPKIFPENVCLIGVRSFELAELELINKCNIRVFFMEEVKKRGMQTVMTEAVNIVTKQTSCYGVSIDIDSINPKDAPGTGMIESDGIPGKELCKALTLLSQDKRLIGAEIVEFDPSRDKQHKTEKLIARMLLALLKGEFFA